MAGRRLRGDSDESPPEQSEEKRMRRLPSFSTVIEEAVVANKLQTVHFALEPLLRRVVREEVERILIHGTRFSQSCFPKHNEAAEPSSLKLIFVNQPSRPIFTGGRIEDTENNPLQILVVDTKKSVGVPPSSLLPSPLRVELVALDGDFASGDEEDWTSHEFQSKIVRERAGKRPLLVGDVNVTLTDGVVLIPELCFTDNSSWTKSGKFKIGARTVPGSYTGPRIREAMTEPFKVKDHRGESYKKHHPPALGDEVWRLEKISKDGVFHRKLAANNINTVQDFLKLWHVDPDRLRQILGKGMSDRTWEATIGHAKECVVGDKLYLRRSPKCDLLLNPVCEVVAVVAGTAAFAPQQFNRAADRTYIHQLAREAYANWDHLEEYEGSSHATSMPQQQSLVI
ncbi:unnamed protein product [Musa hybrid cultivar]